MADEDRITGFEFVGATPLTEEQYSTSFVNFYNQFLGLPTLEEETGVEVETGEDITELREMAPAERGEASERSVLGPGGTIGYQDISIYDGSSMSSFGSYKEALQAAGLNDRVPFVENIVDPIMSGNVMGIEFGKQAGVVAEQTAAEFKEVVSTAGIKQKVAKAAPKAMAGVTTMVAPGLFGAGIGGLLTGKSFVNAFGKPSFRPGGILGAVTDFVAARQYEDMAAINVALGSKDPVPTGFAMSIGNMGITRAPGSGVYTGNMQGMSHKQVKAIEALAKGFVPTGYNLQQETGTSLREAGYNTGQLSTGGYYKEDGTYMDGFGNTSAMGLEKDLNALADKYGITPGQASNALSNARQGNGTLSENLSNFATQVVGMSRPSATAVTRTKYDIAGGVSPSFGPGISGPGPRLYEDQAFNLFGLSDGIIVGGTGLYDYKAGTFPSSEVMAADRKGLSTDFINAAIKSGEVFKQPETQRQSDADKQPATEQQQREGDTGDRPDRTSPDRASVGSFSRGDFGGSRGFVGGFAQGGPIGLQAGGMAGQSGFVQQPPSQVSEGQTVADNVETQLPEGAFVINAAAVEFAGESDIRKMLVDAQKEAVRRGLTSGENGARINRYIDVAISRGEVVVSPHLAKIIGYDRLEKINNRGKRETQQRIEENGQQQAGAATGMLISGMMKKPKTNLQDQGFIAQPEFDPGPLPPRDTVDTFFGYTLRDIKDAIRDVEIKGFEDNPYIFTGIRRKNAASSAFGPMQITASTLKDLKERSEDYQFLDTDTQEYIDALIQQGDDKVNVEKYGSIYRDGKRQTTPKNLKKKFSRYGEGIIPREKHEELYEVVADLVIRQKLSDHKTLKDALASYGEGTGYAQKVLKGLE